MHYLQCIFIWLIATSYSCANPIPSENEAESEKVANDTHRGIIAEDKALELESILERENQMSKAVFLIVNYNIIWVIFQQFQL